MVNKSKSSFGIFGLCVALTVSFGTTLRVAEATNECCEFAIGCASAPTGQLPTAVCTAQGGISHIADSKCDSTPVTGGNCVANAGAPEARTCCLDATTGVCANTTASCTALFIPTVSQWGLAVMVLLVLTAGTIVVMRRRAVVTA